MDEDTINGSGYKVSSCVISLIAGLAIHFISELPPVIPAPLAIGSSIAIGLSAALFVFSMKVDSWRRDAFAAIALGLIAGLLYWQFTHFVGSDDTSIPDFSVAFTYTVLILLAVPMVFYQVARDEGRLAFPYAALFRISWERAITAKIAFFFFCCAWGILFLWSSLFDIIGIQFFEDLFFETDWFRWAFGGLILGLGVAIARGRPALLQASLRIVLTLFKYLSVGLAFVILLFIFALPFTGLEKFWSTGFAGLLLIAVTFVMILFQNAVIQNSDDDADGYGRYLAYLIMGTNVILPVLAGLAILALNERITQYGITPERYYAGILSILALAYAIAYALSVLLRRQHWASGVRTSNRILAAAVTIVAVVIHLPYVNAFEVSARNQVDRLISGKVAIEEFDFAFLKHRLGQPGEAGIERLRSTIANADTYIDNTDAARQQKLARALDSGLGNIPNAFAFHPSQTDLINRFFDAQFRQHDGSLPYHLERCITDWTEGESPACGLIQIDLTKDGLDDVILVSDLKYNWVFIQEEDGDWRIGNNIGLADENTSLTDILALLREGSIETIAPIQQDIRIGDVILRQTN